MSADTAISMVERFFLDLIGSIIPGALLLIGAQYLIFGPLQFGLSLDPSSTDFEWILFITIAYVLGHAVASISSQTDKVLWFDKGISGKLDQIQESVDYTLFVAKVQTLPLARTLPADPPREFNTYRSLAMSLAPEEDGKVYRFMFLSLLNGGVATVLLLLTASWLIAAALPSTIAEPVHDLNWFAAIVLLGVSLFLFRERQLYFFRIANQIPFSVAAVKVTALRPFRAKVEEETS